MSEALKGRFRARAREWDFGESSKNTEQIAVQFEITEGDEKGRTLTWYGYFTDKTAERTLESMRFMGWTGDDPTHPDNLNANEVEIVVEPEEYTNDKGETKIQSRIRWVNRAGGIALKSR